MVAPTEIQASSSDCERQFLSYNLHPVSNRRRQLRYQHIIIWAKMPIRELLTLNSELRTSPHDLRNEWEFKELTAESVK
jgi:hypothetical protein